MADGVIEGIDIGDAWDHEDPELVEVAWLASNEVQRLKCKEKKSPKNPL